MLFLGIFLILLSTVFLCAVYRAPTWLWGLCFLFGATLAWLGYSIVGDQNAYSQAGILILEVLAILFFLITIPTIRRSIIIKPLFNALRKNVPKISSTEREALEVGGVGFEAGFFLGRPDWVSLRSIPALTITPSEQAFLDGPVRGLCEVVDSWVIRHKHRKIPDHIWKFISENGLLGLRILGENGKPTFSFQAQSVIINMIASHSLDVATIVGVQNSLGPDELIGKYGTEDQKKHYLPRFLHGKDTVAFAITSPHGGSDVPSMKDFGRVTHDFYQNERVLGVRLTWDKRYVTFAPRATLFVLAFRLFDPENLLGIESKNGITLALIPREHPGVISGYHHNIGGAVFPNGPTQGKDVFIPLDWIIGGKDGVGKGWKMIMESLFVGRAVTLPSMSAAVTKAMLRHSTAYAGVRRQFGRSINSFEGVEESLIRLIEASYTTESARTVTSAMIDRGERPSSIASLMKYQTTEYARRATNDAMDIYGGLGVCDGPSNYLQAAYQMAPIGITVEGANIVTRSLITPAQGILRAHPYLFSEMESFNLPDQKIGLLMFERALSQHISFLVSNLCRSLFHNVTNGIFGSTPKDVPPPVMKWYRQLWRASCNFASVVDITAVSLRGMLKKKQKIGGRIADAMSELYFLSCILKRYEDDGFPEDDYPIVELCAMNSLYRFKNAMHGVVSNLPNVFARRVLQVFLFRLEKDWPKGSDTLGHDVAMSVRVPSETRDRITRFTYLSSNPNNPITFLEDTFRKVAGTEPIYRKIYEGIRSGIFSRVQVNHSLIDEAEQKNVLTRVESQIIRDTEERVERVIAVDSFSPDGELYIGKKDN